MTIHRGVRRSTAASSIRLQHDPVRLLAAALEQLAETQAFDAGGSLPGIPKQVVDPPAGPHPAQADSVVRSVLRSIIVAGADARANLRLAGLLSLIAIAAALAIPGLGPPSEDDSSFVFSDDAGGARRSASVVTAESISLGPADHACGSRSPTESWSQNVAE